MTPHPSDVAHARADIFARSSATRSDRTATHARFTALPAGGEPVPADVVDVDLVSTIRISTRWTGAEDPNRANLWVCTVEDKDQGAALASWPLWRVETWTPVAATRYTPATWWWAVDYRVAVDACLVTPAWVEVEGWSQIVRAGYGEDRAGSAPPWLTARESSELLAASTLSPDPGWR